MTLTQILFGLIAAFMIFAYLVGRHIDMIGRREQAEHMKRLRDECDKFIYRSLKDRK